MRVASFQGPAEAHDAIEVLREQLSACEVEGVKILCTPEAFIGGLADECFEPPPFAIRITGDGCPTELKPLADSSVMSIVGFTELGPGSTIYNSAAVLGQGQLHGLYRKVFPAQRRSSYSAGNELPVFAHSGTTFGIVICNDSNYVEPARVMAKAGASVLFVPMNNALPLEIADRWRTRAGATLIARAVENAMCVVGADVAGHSGDRVSYGATAVYGPDGDVLAAAEPLAQALIIAEIPTQRPSWTPGWDVGRNESVACQYAKTLAL